jgi:hypothetical protein
MMIARLSSRQRESNTIRYAVQMPREKYAKLSGFQPPAMPAPRGDFEIKDGEVYLGNDKNLEPFR